MEISELGFDEHTGHPFAKANVDIIDVDLDDDEAQPFDLGDIAAYGRGDMRKKVVVDFKGIALQIEGEPTSLHPQPPNAAVMPPVASALVCSRSSTPPLRAPAVFRGPLPPAALLQYGGAAAHDSGSLSWHPLADKNGAPTPGFTPTDYPPRAIAFVPFAGTAMRAACVRRHDESEPSLIVFLEPSSIVL